MVLIVGAVSELFDLSYTCADRIRQGLNLTFLMCISFLDSPIL